MAPGQRLRMAIMTTILITGANKGLGKETARQLLGLGHTVYVGARDISRGRETAEELGARFIQLDVTDDDSVRAAAAALQYEIGSLDVLVNNAGIPGNRKTVPETTADDLLAVYRVNVFGAVRVTHAMLAVLEAAPAPTIVNVSSGLGSLAVTTNPDRLESSFVLLAYPSPRPPST
jgi:NAD(P)-dependent dehydrogenase (short-subunit alcohol dehydrogenase family)